MQRKSSRLIPSWAEWRAMLWGGLYALAVNVVLGIVSALLPPPMILDWTPGFWDAPIWFISTVLSDPPISFMSAVLSDPASLISYFGIPGFLSSLLYGMLGGLILYWMLERRARQRPLLGRDGWVSGAAVGGFMAIAFTAQTILAAFEHGDGFLGWGLSPSPDRMILSLLFTVLLPAVLGATRGAHLVGTLRRSSMVEARTGQLWIAGLLVVSAFAMYFIPAAVRQLVRVPSTPTTFTIPGDFGILSQQPCTAPCFQGITPGITSAQDAFLILREIGPCTSGGGFGDPDLFCGSGPGEISVYVYRRSKETKSVVDSIILEPPVRLTVGDFIAQYGPPDAAQAATEGADMPPWFLDSIYYDRSRVTLHLPRGALKDLTPQTEIYDVTYWSADSYQQARDAAEDAAPWSGYGSYMPGWGRIVQPTPRPGPTPTPAYPDLAISMEQDCGFGCRSRLTIDDDGNVGYERTGPGKIQEKMAWKITPPEIEQLVMAIYHANVWAIEDQQDQRCHGCGPVVLTIALNGQTKRVSRDDVSDAVCGVIPSGRTPVPHAALSELVHNIAMIASPDPLISSGRKRYSDARLAITVFHDANGDGEPQLSEGLGGSSVRVIPSNGVVLTAITDPAGLAQVDLVGFATGSLVTVRLGDAYPSYCFYLPESGTVPILFNVDR